MFSVLNRALSWAITSFENKFCLKMRSRLIKALNNRFYVKFMQLEIGLLHIKMSCHSEIGQSKSLFLLTVALLVFKQRNSHFGHGNGHSDWLTEWLFLYNYRIRIIYRLAGRLASTKDLRFST